MSTIPADYPPPVTKGEFIATELSSPEQRIDIGVLFVGAGPANLAGAIRLAQLLNAEPEVKAKLGECPLAVIEKGKYPGAHLLSGAVINPAPFQKLFPNLSPSEFPFCQKISGEAVYFLTKKRAFRAPLIPPTMKNHGNYVASLSKVGKWLAQQAEGLGVMILNETVGAKVIVRNGAVSGIRTGDKGRDRHGEPLSNFEPGVDALAQFTVFGEGGTGHLTQVTLEYFDVKRPNPQIYALGVKEIWEVKKPLQKVVHTMGWPLKAGRRYREFGGSFAYPLGSDKISLGLVVGLDYADASLSIHDLFQEMKTHPFFKKMIEGGRRADDGWGAKTIPEGGFYSLPERLHVPGACFVGDAAGFVNVPALKGIHYAMESGMLAAEAIFELLKKSGLKAPMPSDQSLENYDRTLRQSFIWKDLYKVRNMRQAFHFGFYPGAALAGLMTLTGGYFPNGRFKLKSDSTQPLFDSNRNYPKNDRLLTFDKLDSVYGSGNRSPDNQPNHLRVTQEVSEIVGKAWIQMCPAGVYEWAPGEAGQRKLQIIPTNCVHCGAITAKGGRLTPPEGGSGPEYSQM